MLEDIIEAPVSRRMNSENIEKKGIFVVRLKQQTIIYLDDIMLLKKTGLLMRARFFSLALKVAIIPYQTT